MSLEGKLPEFDPRPQSKTTENPFDKVLITGSHGFIGRHLTKFLREKGYEVRTIDIENGGVSQDITSMLLNNEYYLECGHVIHLAAMAGVRESMLPGEAAKYLQTNVFGTFRIFNHFHHRRVIYASSSNAYDPWRNIYALTKRACESMALDFNKKDDNGHRIPGTQAHLALRFTNVYGPGCRRTMLVPKIINGDIEYLSKMHERNYVHVEDVCSAIHILMQDREMVGVLDIGTNDTVKLSEFKEKFNLDVPEKEAPMYECPHNNPDERDLKKLYDMGWEPKHTVVKYVEEELKKRNN